MNARTPEQSAAVFKAASWNSSNRYMEGLRKSYDIYRRIILPPRGKVGSRANELRARTLQAALHQAKWGKGQRCDRRRRSGRCSLCTMRLKFRRANADPESAEIKPRGPSDADFARALNPVGS
jgi:hypothetical protein